MGLDAFIEKLKTISLFRAAYRLPGVSRCYHFILAFAAAALYGFPSRRMTVIGVTGTKGKTTTCNLIAQILNYAGKKTGLLTTVNIAVPGKERVNDTKQTMLGRLQLQGLLREMADAGCGYAVIETSSEGIIQYRHRFIDYDVAVFTNLSPEHIERHGSFEKYRAAKVKLFERVAKKDNGVGVYNLDDPNVAHFLKPPMSRRYGYGRSAAPSYPPVVAMRMTGVRLGPERTTFTLRGERFETPFAGEFNAYNAAAAACVAISQGISAVTIREALRAARPVPGRLERIECGQGFIVIVDYAHEPASLEALYNAVRLFKPKRMICVLGSQGGGRDRWKRPAMAKVAATHCDTVILTNEDPYDEPPYEIVAEMCAGIPQNRKVFQILDRREAIRKAISLAKKGDAVVISGKGGEVWMCVANNKKIPWSDREIVKEELEKTSQK